MIEEIIGADRELYDWEVAYEENKYCWLQILEEPMLDEFIKNPKKFTAEQRQEFEGLRAQLVLNVTQAIDRYYEVGQAEWLCDDEGMEISRVNAEFFAKKADDYYNAMRMYIAENLTDGHIERG